MLKLFRNLLILFSLCLAGTVQADVRLPQLVSSGMVLQRDAELTLWGWADPKEEITLSFRDKNYSATADAEGQWQVALPPLKAGGPFTLTIKGDNTVVVEDVLVGDVWLGSGQSNMELTMARVEPRFPAIVANANNSRIRYFDVPDRYNFKQPEADLEGGQWQAVTPETIKNISALGYFFASRIHEQQKVPVGFINASLGGSPVEAWISEEALKQFPEPYKEAQRFKDDALIEKITADDQARSNRWFEQLHKRDKGVKGDRYLWADPELDTATWSTMTLPGYWPEDDGEAVNGVFWFRKTIDVPKKLAGQPAKLILGAIVDADTAFVNGTQVGNTTYQYPPRRYDVPADVLREGKNVIAVRVVSQGGRGGFVPDKDYQLQFERQYIELAGEWQYKLGATMPSLAGPTFIRWKPVGLYNGMIAPLTNYRIKGAVWYQGESNVSNAGEYRERFSTMISDWREQWNQGDFPFLFAQLANFLEAREEPGDSDWARLREAQAQTLAVANTGMAVAIDIGEWNDIHPLDKKTLGERLAASAFAVAYDQEVVHSGPQFESAKINDGRVHLRFSHTGSGLVAHGDKLQGFAIAGPDKQFVWAKAEIRDGVVVVWSDQVDQPRSVRYAWADNPTNANLYNQEGFPAVPFRTDDW